MKEAQFMINQAEKTPAQETRPPLTSYHEVTIGRTLYRVTSVYKGEIELKKALEDLTVNKALRSAQAATGTGV